MWVAIKLKTKNERWQKIKLLCVRCPFKAVSVVNPSNPKNCPFKAPKFQVSRLLIELQLTVCGFALWGIFSTTVHTMHKC
jgi:hypothetical protein